MFIPNRFILRCICYLLMLLICRMVVGTALSNEPEFSDLSTNSVWFATYTPTNSITNVSLEAACNSILEQARTSNERAKNINIDLSAISDAERSRIVSLRGTQSTTILDALYNAFVKAFVDFRIMGNLAIAVNPEYRYIPVCLFIQCIDSANDSPVLNFDVSTDTMGIYPIFQSRILHEKQDVTLWYAKARIPFFTTSHSISIVDYQTWNMKAFIKITAPGFNVHTNELRIFSSQLDVQHLNIMLQRSSD